MSENISTLAQFIDDLSETKPNEIISTFVDEINVFTLKELNERASLLAKGLIYIGVQKKSPVALVLQGTTSCLTFVLSLAKIGAVLIPLSKEWPLRTLSAMLKEEKIHTLGFLSEEFASTFRKLVPDLSENERGYLDSPTYPDLKNIVTYGSLKNRGMFTTRELMLLGSHVDDLEMESLLESVNESDVFMKKAIWDANKKYRFVPVLHREIIQVNPTFPALQNYLLNSI
ncbi:MAG TPA: AMP-binding protein [Prolixibacteraceae bacterium]|nr:AMP-binding protein [Prolixibacteraceae bacterium]